jgi:pimeloyl-ACP methyl ester carboxylesterase
MSTFKDVVVLLPGITGSVLANAAGKEVWSPSAGAIWRAITSFGGSITDLEITNDDPGGVTAPRLIPDFSVIPGLIKIDGYTRIEKYLVSELGLAPGKNYFPFPYDWRLDNRINARRLESAALGWLKAWRAQSGAADARLILVGHSMGGLICRWFLECLGGWQHTRALFTLGTPHRGSMSAVNFLVNGMKKGIGPLGLDLSPLLRSLTSVYQLLPIYPCIDRGIGALDRVASAAQHGAAPQVDSQRALAARAFHQEIEDAQKRNAQETRYTDAGYRMVPLVGIEQPTLQSAQLREGKLHLLQSYEGRDMGGDGTVPRVSATPIELSDANAEIYAADSHGSLQNADATLAQIKGVATQPGIDLRKFRADVPVSLTLQMDDAVAAGEPFTVRARASIGQPVITAHLTELASGKQHDIKLKRATDDPDWQQLQLALPAGIWRVRINADGASPVTDLAVVGGT